MKRLLETIAGTGWGGAIRHAFDCIDVAEELLAGRDVPGLFLALCPTDPIAGKARWLYRAHAEELIGRAARGEDLRPGTDAECLAALMDVAARAPLRQDAAAAVDVLWDRIDPPGHPPGTGTPETHPGAAEEVIAETRRRIRVETRRLR